MVVLNDICSTTSNKGIDKLYINVNTSMLVIFQNCAKNGENKVLNHDANISADFIVSNASNTRLHES